MKKEELEKPTDDLIDRYIENFNKDKRYKSADDSITKLLKKFPKNDSIESIFLKTTVINEMYSTNIYGTFKMAEHILKMNIDKGLENGDPKVVHQIATGHGIRRKKNNKELNFYSFATKYCSWHNLKSYAIYDSNVEKVLLAYKRKDKFSIFKKLDLKDSSKFQKIISDFSDYYKLTKYDLKSIDKFLWAYGREKFK